MFIAKLLIPSRSGRNGRDAPSHCQIRDKTATFLSRVESRPVPEKPGEFRPERPGSVPGVPYRYGLKRRRFDKQQTTSFSQYTGKQITLSSSRSQSQTHDFFPQSIPDFSQSQINPESDRSQSSSSINEDVKEE